jgi:hypothetical protein
LPAILRNSYDKFEFGKKKKKTFFSWFLQKWHAPGVLVEGRKTTTAHT